MAVMELEAGSQTTVICVDSYDQQIMNGRLYNPVFKHKAFRSTQEFLAAMDVFLQAMNHVPVAAKYGSVDTEDHHEESSREGVRGTFLLRILFQKNASWQGKITWLEGGVEKTFRSALELLKMLDNALNTREMLL